MSYVIVQGEAECKYYPSITILLSQNAQEFM